MIIREIHTIYRYLFRSLLSCTVIQMHRMIVTLFVLLILWLATPTMAHDGQIHISNMEKVVSWAGLIVVISVGVARLYFLMKADNTDDSESSSQ